MNEPKLSVNDALQESSYIAGLKRGFNLGLDEDRAQLIKEIAARAGYLRPVAEARTVSTVRNLARRVHALEELAHEPYDFTHLVKRIEALEARTIDDASYADLRASGGIVGAP